MSTDPPMSDPQALHTELLGDVEIQRDRLPSWYRLEGVPLADALTAVLELHKPIEGGGGCNVCAYISSGEEDGYPCQTVEVIASALGVVADG